MRLTSRSGRNILLIPIKHTITSFYIPMRFRSAPPFMKGIAAWEIICISIGYSVRGEMLTFVSNSTVNAQLSP